MRAHRAICAATLVAFAFTACKQPAPPALPAPPAPSESAYGKLPRQTVSANVPAGVTQRFLVDMDVPGEWWTLFHSTGLNALVKEALVANPDVAAAQAALRAARETYYAQRSSAYPTAQGSFGISRQQSPTFYAPPLNNNISEYVYGVHTASLDVAYTPDVFGNIRYQTASAADAAEMQRYEVEATYLTLTTNVVGAVISAASLRDQIAATRRIIALDRSLLELTRTQRFDAQADRLDVLNQEAALRAEEQAIPPLEKSLAQTNDLLARLVGRAPGQAPPSDFSLAALQLPQDLPLSLPSKLVLGRPDIAAATANLREAGAQVGVAYTNRLPNFSITAQTATQALSLFGLFGAGTLLSTLTAEVSTTFYDHGTLKHREASAVAAYDEAAAQYKSAMLSGFQNVADSVVATQSDADALVAAAHSTATAESALRIVRVQLQSGEVSNAAVLTAEETYEQAVLAQIQAEAARYTDTAALLQALGGGWWNRNDIPPG